MSLEIEAIADTLLDTTSAGNLGVFRQTHDRDAEVVGIILTSEGDRRTARQDERNEQDWWSLHISFDEEPALEVPAQGRRIGSRDVCGRAAGRYGEKVKRELAWSPEALRTAVLRLAYPERDGVAYLRQSGSYPSLDELALTLDEELGRVRAALPPTDPLLRLEEQLSEMSGRENAALWHVGSLDAEPWIAVRRIALEAVAELDQHPV